MSLVWQRDGGSKRSEGTSTEMQAAPRGSKGHPASFPVQGVWKEVLPEQGSP